MKQFYSFKSAIEHHVNCPSCQSLLQINDRDLAVDLGYRYREGKEKITFHLDQREQDTITIDPETEEVEIILHNRLPFTTLGVNGIPAKHYPVVTPTYDGKFYHALTLDCKYCCKYSYTLQLQFSLKPCKLLGAYLNSENLSLEEGKVVHEIKNVYATEQTHYTHFAKDGDCKRITLPLIPLNLDNPQETVNRIRKLLIFS